MSEMSEMNRRTAIAAMLATATAGLAPGAEAEEAWPHPHIGKDAVPRDWKPGKMVSITGDNQVVYGIFIMNGHVLSRGRVYTSAEFDPIKAELEAYIARRNPVLEEKGKRLVRDDFEREMATLRAEGGLMWSGRLIA